MNNLNIPFDNKTPRSNNKFDNSPHTNLSIPGFKTPIHPFVFKPEEDGSKGMQGIPPTGEDFASKLFAFSKYLFKFPIPKCALNP